MTKQITIKLTFDEVVEDEDYTDLVLKKIERTSTDFTDAEIDALGERIAQTDRWQVDNWIDIQTVLGDADRPKVKVSK